MGPARGTASTARWQPADFRGRQPEDLAPDFQRVVLYIFATRLSPIARGGVADCHPPVAITCRFYPDVTRLHHVLQFSLFHNKELIMWQKDCTGKWPREERLMSIIKITGQGLATIALSVALLWGCLIDGKGVGDPK